MKAVASRNIKYVGHTDQGGRGDGVQVMVNRGYAYIGHGFSNGITVIDVHDAKHPKPVNFLACPPNTRAHHLQTHEDLLLAVNGPSVWTMQVSQEAYFSGTSAAALEGQKFTGGLRIFDISRGEAPREIAFLPLGVLGPHRIWYVGGRYAYVSVHLPEFSDHVLVIVDVAEPTKPQVAGKFWLPGMWTAWPVAISTAIVSPTARPTPSSTAASRPFLAAGTSTRYTSCQRVAPSANPASR